MRPWRIDYEPKPDIAKAIHRQYRAVTVEGQIESAPTESVAADKIKLWERLTGKNWQKELERRQKKN